MVEGSNRSPDDPAGALHRVGSFGALGDEELRRLAERAEVVRLDVGERVSRMGEELEGLYVLLEGAVELMGAGDSEEGGGPPVLGPGECLGEVEVLAGLPANVTATVKEPAVMVRLTRQALQELMADTHFAMNLLGSVARRATPPGLGEVSRAIQRALLPTEMPRIEGYEAAAGTSLVGRSEGRTLWDSFALADGRVGLGVFSVQGSGLPPAHALALTRALLRELGKDRSELEGVLARVNSGLVAAAVEGRELFVEAGVLLPGPESVQWMGAGQCAGAVIRRNGVFEEFSSHGPPLGVLDGFQYAMEPVELGAGDAVLVLSNASAGIFRGAADLVASLQGNPVGEVVETVQKALRRAGGAAPQEASVLFLRRG